MPTTAKATPRPRSQRWHTTHTRILDVASTLFYDHGINSVGVETIAAAAHTTKATLYSHFPSKDDLVAACLDDLDLRYHEWFVREVSRRAEDPIGRLRAAFDVLDGWFHHRRFRGCAFINATVELTDGGHPAREVVRAHKKRTIEYLQNLLDDADLQSAQLAQQLMLLMEGAIATALVQEDLDAARTAGNIAGLLIDTTQAE